MRSAKREIVKGWLPDSVFKWPEEVSVMVAKHQETC